MGNNIPPLSPSAFLSPASASYWLRQQRSAFLGTEQGRDRGTRNGGGEGKWRQTSMMGTPLIASERKPLKLAQATIKVEQGKRQFTDSYNWKDHVNSKPYNNVINTSLSPYRLHFLPQCQLCSPRTFQMVVSLTTPPLRSQTESSYSQKRAETPSSLIRKGPGKGPIAWPESHALVC